MAAPARGAAGRAGPGSCKAGASQAPRWMVYTAFAVLAALAATLVWATLRRGAQPPVRPPVLDGFAQEREQPLARRRMQLVYLHMNGCGWCVRFTPTWEAFVSAHGRELAALGVETLSFEASSEGARAYRKHARAFPTVLLVAEGGEEVHKFEGDRTDAGLTAFLRDNGVALRGGREGFYAPSRVSGGGDKILAQARETVKENSPSEQEQAAIAARTGFRESSSKK